MTLVASEREPEARLLSLPYTALQKIEEIAHAQGATVDSWLSDAIVRCVRLPETPAGSRDTVRVILSYEASRVLRHATSESHVVTAAVALALSPSAPIARLVPPPTRSTFIRPRLSTDRMKPVLAALDARGVTLVDALTEGALSVGAVKVLKAPPGPAVTIDNIPTETMQVLHALRKRRNAQMSAVVLAALEHWLHSFEKKQQNRRSR